MPTQINMVMQKTKETKGTVVFTEIKRSGDDLPDDERAHTFYILKDTFNELGSPEELRVTLATGKI